MTEHYCLITFDNTHTAIHAEQQLLASGLKVRLIPVPTQITAGCGLSLRFDEADYNAIKKCMPSLPETAFYHVVREGRQKTVTAFFASS